MSVRRGLRTGARPREGNIHRSRREDAQEHRAADPRLRSALGTDRPQISNPASKGRPLALPDKPSIAVLPFQNMSGDPEQDYFADGMVEDIVTGLSRIKWLFVIARNSSFVYKGKAVDVRQVGRELGVRYILEGGVRKSGNRLRVTAQLVEAETGAHLWANRYDGESRTSSISRTGSPTAWSALSNRVCSAVRLNARGESVRIVSALMTSTFALCLTPPRACRMTLLSRSSFWKRR